MTRAPAIGVLDLGASGGRVMALRQQGSSLRLAEAGQFDHAPQHYWQRHTDTGQLDLRRCWDLGRIYQGMLDGLHALACAEDLSLASFGVDTWGSDGAWMNAAGDLLGMAGTGRDARWQIARAELEQRIDQRALFALTATTSEPFCVLNQLYWYARHEPGLVAAAATYMPVGSLLHFYLCGERAAERTWMSTTQLNRPGAPDYQRTVFERLELPQDKMPTLVPPGTRLGLCHPELAGSLGLPRFEVVVPAMHDTASAYVAAPRHATRRSILVSSGTFTLVGIPRDEPLVSDAAYAAGLTNIGGCEEVYFHSVIMGSWPAQELRRLWCAQDGHEVSWEDLDRLACAAAPLQVVLDIDDELFRAPASMEEAVATFCRKTGQAAPEGRPGMIRAAYEGLALKIAVACAAMQALADYAADEILLVGGGVRNHLVNQWLADASGLPVRTGAERATAAGNALVQARALGWIRSLEEGRGRLAAIDDERVYEPQPAPVWEEAKARVSAWSRV